MNKRIKLELTEDQARQLQALVSMKEITMGRESKKFVGAIKKSYEDEAAFWRRIEAKLAQAKS